MGTNNSGSRSYTTTYDGGPAFPSMDVHGVPGMFLRDHFAGLAMQGWLAGWPDEVPLDTDAKKDKVAAFAYGMADAMLRAKGA